MTDKELRRLSRKELLQMLLIQSRELNELREKYSAAQAALNERSIKLENAGSIAEAALRLNGVFEAADAACRQYTENASSGGYKSDNSEPSPEERAERILAEANARARLVESNTRARCEELLRKVGQQLQRYQKAALAADPTGSENGL